LIQVTPAADGKKCIYEPSLNKIYLTPGTFEFKVKLNWNELSYDANANLLLRTQVDFTDPGYCQVPVKKCMNCMASQQKLGKLDSKISNSLSVLGCNTNVLFK